MLENSRWRWPKRGLSVIVGKKIVNRPVQRRERKWKSEGSQEALFGATDNGCGSIVFALIRMSDCSSLQRGRSGYLYHHTLATTLSLEYNRTPH